MVELERHKSRRIAKGGRLQIQHEPEEEDEDIYANADPKKWKMTEVQFDSQYAGDKLGKERDFRGKSIKDAIKKFKKNPQ